MMKKVTTTLSIIAMTAFFMFRSGRLSEQSTMVLPTNKTIISGNKSFDKNLVLNDGLISPGHSPGKITVTGNFTMGDSAIYKCEIKDTTGAGTGHDQIDISGNTTLAGTLDIVLDGYSPKDNDIFEIIKYGGTLSGTFGAITGMPIGWKIDYGEKKPGSVTIYGPNILLLEEELHSEEHFSFYPNPATKTIFFNKPVESVSIQNVQGKEVLYRRDIKSDLNISTLRPGIYIIDINRGVYKDRLIIE